MRSPPKRIDAQGYQCLHYAANNFNLIKLVDCNINSTLSVGFNPEAAMYVAVALTVLIFSMEQNLSSSRSSSKSAKCILIHYAMV